MSFYHKINDLQDYFLPFRTNFRLLNVCLIIFLIFLFGALAFVRTDISITAAGMIRPAEERTEVRSAMTGIIDSFYCREGDLVEKNAVLFCLRDALTPEKNLVTKNLISQRQLFLQDLELLTSGKIHSIAELHQLGSPLYKTQAMQFFSLDKEQQAGLKKVRRELEINRLLARDKVISPKEFFDISILHEKTIAACKAFRQSQYNSWQQDIVRYRAECSQYTAEKHQLDMAANDCLIKAPVKGIVQGIANRYTGGSVQAGEPVCLISPEGEMIGECYVSSGNIGLIRRRQPVRFQIDAFDYNYFGITTGNVISIDNDYTFLDNKPVFKVRCRFDRKQLFLKNGFAGILKKGLTFRARFVIANRTIWQLLFDKLDNWLNPSAAPSAA